MRNRVSLVVFLVSLALSPATAGAHTATDPVTQVVQDYPVALAQRIASRYWQATPCGGAITITYAPETSAMEASYLAYYGRPIHAESWSSWQSPDGPNSKAPPSSTFADCMITFNSKRWPSEVAEDQWFVEFCSDMVREYGNLLGMSETQTGPPSEMSLWNAINPPRCEAFY